MFKLFRLNDDTYQILKSDKRQIEGSKQKIIRSLILEGVPVEEIALGIESLEHADVAEYGLGKTFIYAKKLI